MQQHLIIAFGGASPEHEVSVLTAIQAASALEQANYKLIPLYISKTGRWFTGEPLLELENYEDLKQLEKRATPCTFAQNELGQTVLQEQKSGLFSKNRSFPVYAVLTAFHGSAGENGSFQGVCETFNIPYTGSGVLGSAAGMDKVTSKQLCRAGEVPVVDGFDFFEATWSDNRSDYLNQADKLGYPLVVKPVHLGSSIGVEVVKQQDDLIRAVETAFRYDAHILVEKAISPLMEINCSVLGTPQHNEASVCERPLGTDELLSFQDKYMREDSEAKGMASADREIPADIPEELSDSIRDTARRVFSLFRCSGLARLDFLVNADTREFYFNEINTIPGSFSFYLWKESGISFRELLERIIETALEQHREKNGRIISYETNLLSQKAVKGIKGLKGK
jgi:D-alanine-D-alanine ligase